MQFKTQYRNRPVLIDMAFADDPRESLEGIEITYTDTGEEVDYNTITPAEYRDLHAEVIAEHQSMMIDHAERVAWS